MKLVTIVVEITARVPEGTCLDDVSVEFPGGVQINEGIRNDGIGEYINHSTEDVFESAPLDSINSR